MNRGERFTNTRGQEFEVLEYQHNRAVRVMFVDTGYETLTSKQCVLSGSVRDKLSPSVAGVGCLGYINTCQDTETRRIHKVWTLILNRCYNINAPDYNHYGGKGTHVCDRWKRFEWFYEDYKNLQGYESGVDKQIDKDLRQRGVVEKVYSPQTCVLVTMEENNEEKSKRTRQSFVAISPEGEEILAAGLRPFAKQYQLDRRHIAKCLSGKYGQHKGWTFRWL